MMYKQLLILLVFTSLFIACKDNNTTSSDDDNPIVVTDKLLKIKFKFDPTQERLNNLGNPSIIPSTNAGQNPNFNAFSAHFIELVPNKFTPYKSGTALFSGEELPANNTNSFGFTTAIDFDKSIKVSEGETFIEVPIADLETGTYEHIRISVAYQNYDVSYNLNNIPVIGSLNQQNGTVASFLGYNTHINNLQVDNMNVDVGASKLQGFWAFESKLDAPYDSYNNILTGQAPENATTVVNPFPDAPIPLGSCVVSGSFDQALEITGTEREDITVTLSFSTNGSFEWQDLNGNGEWDLDVQNPAQSEAVVDMGVRGLKASYE